MFCPLERAREISVAFLLSKAAGSPLKSHNCSSRSVGAMSSANAAKGFAAGIVKFLDALESTLPSGCEGAIQSRSS